jgi:hypothetical protein
VPCRAAQFVLRVAAVQEPLGAEKFVQYPGL